MRREWSHRFDRAPGGSRTIAPQFARQVHGAGGEVGSNLWRTDMSAKYTAMSVGLLLAAVSIALPIAAQAKEQPSGASGCTGMFDQERREHCWLGHQDLAIYQTEPGATV